MTTKVEMEPQQVEDGWMIFHLRCVEVEVKLSENYNTRMLKAYLNTPENAPVRVAVPLYGGAGTKPTNTIVLQQIADQGQLAVKSLEDAIKSAVEAEETMSEPEGGW